MKLYRVEWTWERTSEYGSTPGCVRETRYVVAGSPQVAVEMASPPGDDTFHVAVVSPDVLVQDTRVGTERAALVQIISDCENCDWACSNCGHDPMMKGTDIYYAAQRALDPSWRR
jgi:hypothetical protein